MSTLANRAKKARKLWRGFLRPHSTECPTADFWDERLYPSGVSDARTIACKDKLPATNRLHYASIENIILRYLAKSRTDTREARVLDLGAGAGHWTSFFLDLGASQIVAVEIAPTACEHLEHRYAGYPVRICYGDAVSVMQDEQSVFDIIIAVGFMFHVVKDDEWKTVIDEASRLLRQDGLFIASGHFGLMDGLDVQVSRGCLYKRLRSARRWKRTLRHSGFGNIKIRRNYAYLYAADTMPENNVLFARRRARQ